MQDRPTLAQATAAFSARFAAAFAALGLLLVIAATPAMAQNGCADAIAQFRRVIDSDVETGNVAKSVHARITPELARVTDTCRAGQDGPAQSALVALKRRYGYR